MNRGYIKLWRKLRNHEIMSDAYALQLFINLLLNAAWNKSQHEMRGQKIQLEPGEVVFGRRSFAHKLMSTERNVRSALAKLIRLEMVTVKEVSKRYSVISIVNWKKYQGPLEAFDEDDCPTETVEAVGQNGKVRPTEDSKKFNDINVSHRTTHRTTHRNQKNCPTECPTDCPTETIDTVSQSVNPCPTECPTERPTESQKSVPQTDPQNDHIEEDKEEKEKTSTPHPPTGGSPTDVDRDPSVTSSDNVGTTKPGGKRKSREKVQKEDKPARGANKLVRLTDEECWRLAGMFDKQFPGRGKEFALRAIEELDFWFSNNPSKEKKSKDHMKYMQNWVMERVVEKEARMVRAQHDLQRFSQGVVIGRISGQSVADRVPGPSVVDRVPGQSVADSVPGPKEGRCA